MLVSKFVFDAIMLGARLRLFFFRLPENRFRDLLVPWPAAERNIGAVFQDQQVAPQGRRDMGVQSILKPVERTCRRAQAFRE